HQLLSPAKGGRTHPAADPAFEDSMEPLKPRRPVTTPVGGGLHALLSLIGGRAFDTETVSQVGPVSLFRTSRLIRTTRTATRGAMVVADSRRIDPDVAFKRCWDGRRPFGRHGGLV
ncbi:hypothetical protein, partial [Brevundimonas sp.]|uniref:hypothetical protein n=1 Tax=Brevundimonas sp. TaxID=1871086 RepID=UPI002FD9D4C2